VTLYAKQDALGIPVPTLVQIRSSSSSTLLGKMKVAEQTMGDAKRNSSNESAHSHILSSLLETNDVELSNSPLCSWQ
jgi:hypothetical protein